MTDQPAAERKDPPFWWVGADGAKIIRQVWKAVEDVSKHGVETKVTFRAEGQPSLTIAFDWDESDDDVLEQEPAADDAEEPYDPSDFPPQPSAAEEAEDDLDDDDDADGF